MSPVIPGSSWLVGSDSDFRDRRLVLNSGVWALGGEGRFAVGGILDPRPWPPMTASPLLPPPGDALLDAGESMKRLAEVKDSLDIEVKQNFIDPLQNLCDKDLKEIQVRPHPQRARPHVAQVPHSPAPSVPGFLEPQHVPHSPAVPPTPQHHLKKLEGRRLDFDYKKKRQGRIPDEELRQALEKFEESKEVAETSMHNLLETDVRLGPFWGEAAQNWGHGWSHACLTGSLKGQPRDSRGLPRPCEAFRSPPAAVRGSGGGGGSRCREHSGKTP